ncbi:UNVERIFIED_CONTAM: hypothetical protein FKN15_070200 [Acipenser sinensis]
MAGSPGSGGTNPRKFSEKIALHNQKQAEETRAFEQLMTDITLSRRLKDGYGVKLAEVLDSNVEAIDQRVQFQKVQQLQLTQTRAQYYGGSLPNVNQIGNTSADFQGSFTPGLDSMRGTRHHGLVERVSRDRSRLNSPHRRLADKLGRQISFTDPDKFRLCSAHERLEPQSPGPLCGYEPADVESAPSTQRIFPSSEQNAGLSHFQGTLNTGGSLPDLTNLHFPSPLPTPLDPEDGGYPSLSGGSSTGNLPAAMMHLGIGNSQGLSSSLSNPSIQATLNNSQLHSSLSNPSIHSSLRLSSLSNPQQGALSNTPRRRHTPVSPLTLSPGAEQRRGLGMQLSPTMSPSLSPITQHNSLGAFFYDPFMDTQLSGRQSKSLSYQQLDQFNMLENSMSSLPGGSCFDPGSNLCYSQASLMGLGGSHGNLQESLQLRQNMFFSNCGGGIPNIILTDESNPSLSKDISSVLAGVPECFDSEGEFLGNELRIEPLSLDGLSMLSDPDMVLPDPSVEDSFRSDRH